MKQYHWEEAHRLQRAALAAAISFAAGGCTFGVVTDAATNASIQGATVQYQQLTNATALVTNGAPATFAAEPFASPVQTWTKAELAATSPAGDPTFSGFYWLNPYVSERSGDATRTLVLPGWKRVIVSAPGYTTTFAYRNHQYNLSQIETSSPYSGPGQAGQPPYPAPDTPLTSSSGGTTVQAAEEDFAIYRQTQVVHPALPDLIVDVRSLLPTTGNVPIPSPQEIAIQTTVVGRGENECCSTLTNGGNLPPDTQECLAFPMNIANVGIGRFELVSNTATLNSVSQIVYDSAGNHTTTLTSGVIIPALPGGFHVQNLVQVRLRGPLSSNCGTEATAAGCPVVSSANKPICLEHDVDGVYDTQLFNQFTPGGTPFALNGAVLGCAPTVLVNGQRQMSGQGDIDTGLAQGASEMYSIGNAYNYLDITHVAPGNYWLEAEVNPANAQGVRTYMESDTTNNIARAQITITTPPPGGGGVLGCQ